MLPVYYKDSKAYMQATSNVIDQEKMAVILQEVVGTQYGDRYYPAISGVARSINYYLINDELAEEGTVSLALGLGKYIVDRWIDLARMSVPSYTSTSDQRNGNCLA